MKFETFNKKYRNGKRDNVWKYCRDAMHIMKNSKDPVHDHRHVENILGQIDNILKEIKHLKVDYDILVLSVCWHDCWKASKRHGGFFRLIYHQLAEGLASARLFKEHVDNEFLPKNIIKEASYAIRKHSLLQFFPIKSVEAKLLIDADKIEMVNYKRILNTQIENTYFESRRIINFLNLYFNFERNRLSFETNRNQYDILKEEFIDYFKNKL